jgi:hypothetical protein
MRTFTQEGLYNMSKSKSTQIARDTQTEWEPILEYAEEALVEAKSQRARRNIARAIRICEKNIAIGRRIPMREMGESVAK